MSAVKRLLIAILSCTLPAMATAQDKLIMSIDLVRHGDRTSVCNIPTDKISSKENLGELTKKGTQDSIELGKALRQTYINQFHLLSNQYKPETVYVLSTDRERTIMTAEAISKGLYPAAKVRVNSTSTNQDNILVAKPDYHIIALISRYFNQRHTWKTIQEDHKGELTQWGKWSGLSLDKASQLACLADNLAYKIKHHMQLPEGFDQKAIAKINALDESIIMTDFQQNHFPNGDNFLLTTQSYFMKAINHQTKLKYVLFVGHDSTLLSVMRALDVPIQHYPDYNARINFSLYERDHHYYVKVTYDDRVIKQNEVWSKLHGI